MGIGDRAIVGAIELGAETAAGKAFISASKHFAEEVVEQCLPRSISQELLAPFKSADSRYANAELARLISAKPAKDSPFAGFQNLGVFAAEPMKVPTDRVTLGYFQGNEDYWLESMRSRFSAGHIDANTLLVADTGHGPTIAYAMANRFRSDIFMHLPYSPEPIGAAERTQSQAQTFFRGINEAMQAGSRHGSSTVLIRDGHVPNLSAQVAESLPSASTLKSIGITKVLFGIECRPTGPARWIGSQRTPLDSWLTKVHSDGMPVYFDGLDIRPRAKLSKEVSYSKYSSADVLEIGYPRRLDLEVELKNVIQDPGLIKRLDKLMPAAVPAGSGLNIT